MNIQPSLLGRFSPAAAQALVIPDLGATNISHHSDTAIDVEQTSDAIDVEQFDTIREKPIQEMANIINLRLKEIKNPQVLKQKKDVLQAVLEALFSDGTSAPDQSALKLINQQRQDPLLEQQFWFA